MSERLGWIHWLLSRFAFAFVRVDARAVERVRGLSARGSVVYVMNTRSVADYLMVNAVFRRQQFPLPQFANGTPIGWFRSLRWILRRIAGRLARLDVFGGRKRRLADRELARELVARGEPILLFLRTRARLGGRRRPEARRIGQEFLADIVRLARGGHEIFLVPLAPLRGRGYRRKSSRLGTPIYSVHDTPGDAKKLLTFLFNRRDLALTIGEEIPLRGFLERYGHEGDERLVRRLGRVLHLFLVREERVVWGPPLRPRSEVRRIVLGSPELASEIHRIAQTRGVPEERVRAEAERDFDEIAADFRGSVFTLVAFVFRRIWNRMFRGVEVTGLDRVAEKLREHPVVLVPCHRSHFDYLILSYLFHGQFLSPPHIAAGINLSFFPLGPLFRACGAYFIRRTFEDDALYKAVFRQYLAYLIREGYTQEFFIEGGRSRTGKILTPRLGMLGAIVNAFLHGARRDLYLVPVSIAYERLVEEEAYKSELLGHGKEQESLGALIRARRVLGRNYGTAYVNFAEPISLRQALGELETRLRAEAGDPGAEAEKRRFVLKLGFRILEEVNAASVLTAPSLAATVLLSQPRPGVRYADFVSAATFLLELAEAEGASLTRSLSQDRHGFRETLAFLRASGLVEVLSDPEGEVLHVPEEKRLNLDFYKNNSIHLFVLLSLVADALRRGLQGPALEDDVWWWLELLRNEFVLPERSAFPGRAGEILERLRRPPAGSPRGGSDPAHGLLGTAAEILRNFREAYWVVAKTLVGLDSPAGLPERDLIGEFQRVYRANLLLGVLRHPEGNTVVTFQNALRRFAELGYVGLDPQTGRRQGARVRRGPAHASLAELVIRLEPRA
jgi:glycerol-3-phosphate O-acyltransferase